MRKIGNILVIILIFFAFTGCKQKKKAEHTSIATSTIQFTKEGKLTFYDTLGNPLKNIDIEVAKTSYEQQTGLMYRKKMKENRGMLFVYDHERVRPNFYMKNTYIPLDLIYVNAARKIVDFNKDAKPLDESLLPSKVKSQYVLEVNAGRVDKWHLILGDSVSFSYKK